MGTHSEEPWEPDIIFPGAIKTIYGHPTMDASQLIPVSNVTPGRNQEANRRRIIACVNRLEGLTTDQVESKEFGRFLDAAKRNYLRWLDEQAACKPKNSV